MDKFHTALICLNGDMITDSIETSIDDSKFCTKCGAATIHECQYCHTNIRGYCDIDGVISTKETIVPTYCHNCGKPYPWTESKLVYVEKIIDMLDGLSIEQKQELIKFIPDIIIETPRSHYAALIYAKFLDGCK